MGPLLKPWKRVSAQELVRMCFGSHELRETGSVAIEEEQKAGFGPLLNFEKHKARTQDREWDAVCFEISAQVMSSCEIPCIINSMDNLEFNNSLQGL